MGAMFLATEDHNGGLKVWEVFARKVTRNASDASLWRGINECQIKRTDSRTQTYHVCQTNLLAKSRSPYTDFGASNRNSASMGGALHFLQRPRHNFDYGSKDKAPALLGFANDFRGP